MQIIGIHGLINVGKDTIADYIVKKYKYEKAGFADPLKYVCAELFLDNPGNFFHYKEEVMPFWGITRRAALQFVGKELVRDHLWELPGYLSGVKVNDKGDAEQSHWIRVMEKRILDSGINRLVINDLRFQNEADWVIENGGYLVVVKREVAAVDKVGGLTNHSSESGISTLQYPERSYLCNNNGTIHQLYEQVDSIMGLIGQINLSN